MPWRKGGVEPPYFIGKDEKLPLLLSLLMGFQHSLAMVAGIATSGGLLIAGDACFAFQLDSEMCAAKQYMVSAAWIASGLLTVVQVFRARILGTKYYLGTGLISVMGTSFTFLPIARDMVISSISEARGAGLCTGTNNDCVGYGKNGYGRFLGTCMVASLLEVGLAMSPPRYIKALFPPGERSWPAPGPTEIKRPFSPCSASQRSPTI
jgi:NCS2 family nucleobase:cation symporter-2